MTQLELAQRDPPPSPPSPPVRVDETVEFELSRAVDRVLRVVTRDGQVALEAWCVPARRSHWWRYRSLRIEAHEVADISRALLEAGRRARR